MKRLGLISLLTIALGMLAACGGSSSKSSNNNGGGNGQVANSVALTVGPGPSDLTNGGYANILFANVTLCQPGTANCTVIDHVLVDTGSAGLRVLASELPSGFTLNTLSSGSGSLYECLPFLDSYAWGNVVSADVEMAGEKGSSVPVQLITSATAPNACVKDVAAATGNTAVATVDDLGAKGILGIGNLAQDCGDYCTIVRSADFYFSCTSSSGSSCTQAGTPLATQVVNPVAQFGNDNNGIVVQLGSPNSSTGTATGTMYFGIGTQSNNTPDSGVTTITLDNSADFTTKFQSTSYPHSFADTGSNALFFGTVNTKTLATSTGITACNLGDTANPAYFYCPSSELSESATISTTSGAGSATVNFSIGNAQSTTGYAIGDLAGTNTDGTSFDWGLPFFFGRTVYVGLEGKSSSLGSDLYIAF